MYGFETTTAANGEFRFEAPVPTAESTFLAFEPDPFHAFLRLMLGGKRRDVMPPLRPGKNDMGMIRLSGRGAIRGSILDENGAPITGARLSLRTSANQSLGIEGSSDESGNYVVPHALRGTTRLNADAEGYLTESRNPIDVAVGRFTDNVDFVMRIAPTLSGKVVDDSGVPIENVALLALPLGSGGAVEGKSLWDGTFSMPLRVNERYKLQATREGYEPYAVGDSSVHFAPGSRDIHIVMNRLEYLTLLVVDRETNKPITTFGHEIRPNESEHISHSFGTEVVSPPSFEHADGRVEVAFRPGIDVVDVGATGYSPQRFDPGPRIPADRTFLVKLARSACVAGRLFVQGKPADGVAIRLEAGAMEERSMRDTNPRPPRFKPVLNGLSMRLSGLDGSFLFEGVQSGYYRLQARSTEGECANVTNFLVKASETVDLGTIDLLPGSVVRGVVLVSDSRRAADLVVRLDDRNQGDECVTDSEGRFRFAGLDPGWHQIIVIDPSAREDLIPPLDIQLAAGEVKDVTVDARNAGACRVELTILLDGVPEDGLKVSLTSALDRAVDLGETDRHGLVSALVPSAGGATVTIRRGNGLQMSHPTMRLDLAADGNVVKTVRFDTAILDVVLPEALVLPPRCNLRLVFAHSSDAAIASMICRTDVENGHADSKCVSLDGNARRIRFEGVLAGEWSVLFDIGDAANPTEIVRTGDNRELRRKTIYSGRSTLVLPPAQVVELNL